MTTISPPFITSPAGDASEDSEPYSDLIQKRCKASYCSYSRLNLRHQIKKIFNGQNNLRLSFVYIIMIYFYFHVHITGLVQGVGFRSFIYRLATEMSLCGNVSSSSDGVHIIYQTTVDVHIAFIRRIRLEAPPAAVIENITFRRRSAEKYFVTSFSIGESYHLPTPNTRLCPDIAICENCLYERKSEPTHMGYPFSDCMDCGPRYTIVERLSYDRQNTAVQQLGMCAICLSECSHSADRRFHAQQTAYEQCRPHYTGQFATETVRNYPEMVTRTVRILASGGIMAIKGMGGYVLTCNADNAAALNKLRNAKGNYGKPLAVMYASVEVARNDVWIDSREEAELTSWRRPIVLLKTKMNESTLLNNGYRTLGVILPYMGIHYDILAHKEAPKRIVFTSCNTACQPIVSDDLEASNHWEKSVDGLISYDQKIVNRIDDSVVRIVSGKPLLLRRARGYVPEPIRIEEGCEGILACGAQEIGQFAIGRDREALLSPYIGSLDFYPNRRLYHDTFSRFCNLFNFKLQTIVADLNPQYYTHNLHFPQTEMLFMQHHHAHAVSCMVEKELYKETLALCLDGAGYGDDGRLWGGVLMRCDRRSYHILKHLPFIGIPDGDATARQTWRYAAAWIKRSRCTPPASWSIRIDRERLDDCNKTECGAQDIECSSAGRLFDAIASITGIADENRYSGEAPQLIEHAAMGGRVLRLPLPDDWETAWDSLFRAICRLVAKNTPTSDIAATFHHCFADIWAKTIIPLSKQLGIHEILLSGGCMQNKLLTELLYQKLSSAGLTVYRHSKIPCNDAGIAIGQMAHAAMLKQDELQLCTKLQ